MTTYNCTDTLSFRKALDIGVAGDTYIIRECIIEDPIDSYTQRIQGGLSWDKPTIIEMQNVILRPRSGEMALRLAHSINSKLHIFGKLTIDATNISHHALKITDAGPNDVASEITISGVELMNAPLSGAMITSSRINIVNGSSHHNGLRSDPAVYDNLDHGLYISGDHCTVSGFDTHDNAAIGICFYNGAHSTLGGYVQFSRSWNNAKRTPYGAGICLASGPVCADRNVTWGNKVGIQVYDDASDVFLTNNTCSYDQAYPVYISPKSKNTVQIGTEFI